MACRRVAPRRGAQRLAARRTRRSARAAPEAGGEAAEGEAAAAAVPFNASAPAVVAGTTAFNLALAVGADFATGGGIRAAYSVPPSLSTSALWSAPLVGLLVLFLALEPEVDAVRQVRRVLCKTVVPICKGAGPAGIAALAFGAGVGEEALFRGLLQPEAAAALGGEAQGIAVTSVVFGALHATTPLYFWWATGAGALFGYEANQASLSDAALTHAAYDALAFAVTLVAWGDDDGDLEAPVEEGA